MSDIVERLRKIQSNRVFDDTLWGRSPLPLNEAADEIERLRRIIGTVHPKMKARIDALTAERDAARAEVERLNEALISERHGWQAEVERLRREVMRAGGAHG